MGYGRLTQMYFRETHVPTMDLQKQANPVP
jgi:hypothetical protein